MSFRRGVFTVLALVFPVALIAAGCGGSATRSCSDECAQGDRRCSGDSGYEICDNFDDDSCLEWGGLEACASGTSCSNGSCRPIQTGMVLSGELVPAGGISEASGLRLTGAFTRGPGGPTSTNGSLTLDHAGFASR